MSEDNDKTIRLNSEDEDDKTIRFDNDGSNGAGDDKTIRLDADSEKTTRIDDDVISAEVNDDKTTRYDADTVISADGGGNDEKTTRLDDEIISADAGKKPGNSVKSQGPSKNKTPKKEEKTEYKGIEKFTLNTGDYDTIKILSTTSGEASIYLVEKDGQKYVLKLYFHSVKPKLLLLEKIKNMGTFGIIKVHDFGITFIGGEERHFELMEYAEGGTLEDDLPLKDPKKLKTIIDKTAAALHSLHENGIAHKDIKPANIFIRKKGGDDYLISDFGISSLIDEETDRMRTKQNRTEIFAAPELYLSAADHMVDISTKVDWYSLGMSILYMWLGHDPFKNVDRLLIPTVKMKSRFDIPSDMPEDLVDFIKGTTVPNDDDRWGYDEIKRWVAGEKVPVNLQSVTSLDYKPFIFDPARNLEAATPEELAKLMRQEPEVAKKYLYRGKITKWLEESNNTKLAVFVEDIYEKEYPSDEEAGLKAAIYLLDETLPFTGKNGKVCRTEEEFAGLFLDNFDYYKEQLSDPNEDFYIYLRARKFHGKVREYLSIYEKYSKMYALYNIIYSMDPSAPFRFTAKKPDGKWYIITTKDVYELGEYFAKYPDYIKDFFFYGYVQLWLQQREEVEGLSDKERERIVELQNRSEAIMREYKENKDQGIKLACYIFDPELGFLSQDGETRLHTKEEIGNEILSEASYYLDELEKKDSDIMLFLEANLWYDVKDFAKYALDFDRHNEKLGPYTYGMAWLKIVDYLGVTISYTKDDKWYDSPEELLEAPSSVRKQLKEDVEDTTSVLFAWLSLHYQESLETQQNETEYAYEKKLLELFDYLNKLNTGADITKKYEKAKKAIPRRIRKEKSKDHRFLLTKLLAIILPLISGAGLFLYVYTEGVDYFEGQFWTVSGNYYFMFALIFTLIYALTRGFGEGWDFSAGCLGAPIIGLVLAVITFYVMKFTVGSPYIFGGVLALILIFGLYKIFTSSYGDRATRKEIFSTDDKYSLEFEPLAYAFSGEEDFTSQRLQVLDQYSDARKYARKDLLKWGFMPTIVFLGFLALMVTTGESYKKYMSSFEGITFDNITEKIAGLIPSFSGVPEMTGMWEGKHGDTNMLMDVTEQDEYNLKANLSILTPTQQHFSVTGVIDSSKENVTLTDNKGGVYTGTLDGDKLAIAGIYTARGGRKTDFTMKIREEEPKEDKTEAPAEEKKETTPQKTETVQTTENNTGTDNASAAGAASAEELRQSKMMEELDRQLKEDEAKKQAEEDKAGETPGQTTQPAETESKTVTPPVSENKTSVDNTEDTTPAKEEPVVEEKPEEVIPEHPGAMASVTEKGFLVSVMNCRRIMSTAVRVTFKITATGDGETLILPKDKISVTDDKGKTYTPDKRLLGRDSAGPKERDPREKVKKGETVEAGLIFNKIDESARKFNKIKLRVNFGSGWNEYEFSNIKIK